MTPLSDERAAFARLQTQLVDLYGRAQGQRLFPSTAIVIPSLSLDVEELAKIEGVHHYEERLLFMLMLLQSPCSNLIYVTSQPVAPSIVDYYLNYLPGIPSLHARRRLTMLSCYDSSSKPLTAKIIERPHLLQRISAAIPDTSNAYISCFNASALERTLAVKLGVPLYACDPDLAYLGSKSNSRHIFREAAIPVPDGFEDLRDAKDIVQTLAALKRQDPALRRAVVKLNEGFSGEGNAVFSYEGCPDSGIDSWIKRILPVHLQFEAVTETWTHFEHKFEEMGGIVEVFIEGVRKRSPSVQCHITPPGVGEVLSTHDQVLGGPSGQIFLGCTFPAADVYRLDVQEAGRRVSKVMEKKGVIGRFAVDFISVLQGDSWVHYAIEINLRKGGTTHPFMMLQFLTHGTYDHKRGLFLTPSGKPRYYYASDNLHSPRYKGLLPDDLINIAVENGLQFNGATQKGVVFHLISALSQYGKVGVLCIGENEEEADDLYKKTVEALQKSATGTQSQC
ncbi:MAG: peptide ligase PGM1-related protein [Anaerolineae bacterium]|nr:peptide ligase PGM1-related protein [Anaerolineae bacterium]MCO5207724.1 peptide ligase PGM1-related protein [Anaerolineae bacterium]